MKIKHSEQQGLIACIGLAMCRGCRTVEVPDVKVQGLKLDDQTASLT